MADHLQVRHERLYLKEPRTERLRKTATGRLKQLLAAGWRETERWHADDYITVRFERTGVSPSIGKAPKYTPSAPPPRREGRDGGRGGRPPR